MSAVSITELDELIAKATSESIPNGDIDLPVALEISDIIRSRRINPKESMRCLKKRIAATASNPNTQLSTWKLVNICVKNGGTPFIVEICSREFMDTFEQTILKNESDDLLMDEVKTIFMEMYQTFKNDSQLNYVTKVYEKLTSRGVILPEVDLGEMARAMFDSRIPADWQESDACMICSKKFSMLNRRHHCRSCGGIFCQEHSSHNIQLPDLGIYEAVRVCDNCFDDYEIKKHSSKGKKKKNRHEKHRKGPSIKDSEDEQLRRAIELSLKETGNSTEPTVPMVEPSKPITLTKEEEEDPDLKAAIEASLREAEEQKKRLRQQSNMLYETPKVLPLDLTNAEKEDIYLFASLVERMKNQAPNEILEDNQLQSLYRKILSTKPKLNEASFE